MSVAGDPTPRGGSTSLEPPRGVEPPGHVEAWLRRIVGASAVVCLGIGLAALIGRNTGVLWLASWGPNLLPLGPFLAIAFVLAGLALWGLRLGSASPPGLLTRMAALGVVAIGVVRLGLAAVQASGLDDRLLGGAFSAWISPDGVLPMTTATAVGLTLGGLGLSLTCRLATSWRALGMSLVVLLVAIVGLVTLAYRVSPLGASASHPLTSLPAAVGLLAIALGLMAGRPEIGPVAILASDGEGGFLARRLLPATVILPLLLGWLLLQGVWRGHYRSEAATAMLALACAVVFFLMVWRYAAALDRTEAQSRRADAALRESEAFYHSLVETLPQSILRKGMDGRFTFANSKVLAALGVAAEGFVGKSDADFYPSELADKYRQDDARVIESGRPIDTVEEHVEPGGDLRYVQVMKTLLRDPDGRPFGVQCIFWDVTERKLAEEKMQAQNILLTEMARSEKAAHEARKSAQAQLIQTAKLAGLGEMVAGVAHEINNPLSFVSNNAAVLQRDTGELRELVALYEEAEPLIAGARPELMARIRDFRESSDVAYTLSNMDGLLSRTRDGLRRIQQIVKDLRVFARIDASEIAEFDLNESVQTTVGIIAGHAKKKRVTVDLDARPIPHVTGYAAKINQVVMNLVVNAIDACDEGGHVVVRTDGDGRGGVCIVVEDDGPGVPPEIRDRIFDPFFTTKPIGVGTGLGLSISYGIVQDHGGTIDLEPSTGRGARFVVRLPLLGRAEPATAAVLGPSSRAVPASVPPH